jgi:IS1 family transposase
MANTLPKQKQLAVLSALVEGSSVRATARMTGVSIPTVLSIVVRVGEGCAALHDRMMRNLSCTRIECDEIWGFVAKKDRNMRIEDDPSVMGSTWTWVAIDADTKLIPAYRVGKRDGAEANEFIADLASRLRNRVQLSTDGLRSYLDAIELAWGADVDYAQVIKEYTAETSGGPARYSPPTVKAVEKIVIAGVPNIDLASTSYVERQNLTMRMGIRRMTRLTNGFSKKLRNHAAATALHFAHYNFVRRHQTLRVTPAMAAGVADTMWSMEQLLDAALATEIA